ncbi:MAG: hypothetical protein ACPG8W_00280 [Candidatus Promineifilaceae bacterium]
MMPSTYRGLCQLAQPVVPTGTDGLYSTDHQGWVNVAYGLRTI